MALLWLLRVGATNCYYYVANPFLFKRAINMQIDSLIFMSQGILDIANR